MHLDLRKAMMLPTSPQKIMTPKCTMVMNPMVQFVKNSITPKTQTNPRMYNPILANGILRVSGKKKKQKLAGRRIKA